MATIRERNGTYQIRVSLGYDTQGKQMTKTMSWRPAPGMTQKQIDKEIKRQAVLFEEKCKNGLVADGNAKFADYANKWLQAKENSLSPITYDRYRRQLIRINTAIGHIKLMHLQPQHLQEFYKNLGEQGINERTGGGLSAATIGTYHRLIGVILHDALRQSYTTRNVSTLVKPPKVKQTEARHLDENDVRVVYEAMMCIAIKWRTAILLLIMTGVRRGELVGLEWSDINFNDNIIHVHRNTQYVRGEKYKHTDENGELRKGQIIDKETKTEGGNRYINIDEATKYSLIAYRQWWNEQRKVGGDNWKETDKLFTQENGDTMHPESVTNFINTFVKKHNLPKFSPHTLRHTNISLLIANGVDIKTVSSRAGHSNVTTTANTYTHQIQSANARAAEKMKNVLDKIVDFPIKRENLQ